MDKKMLKGLKRISHPLKAKLQVGKGGLNEATTMSLEETLKANELIKVHVLNNAPAEVDVIAKEMADKTGAAIVSVTGRMVVLYRENKERPRVKKWLDDE